MRALVLCAVLGVASGGPAAAQESYRGATEALRQIKAAQAEKPGAQNEASAAFRKELEAFSKQASGLPAAEAASRWLALADRYLERDLAAFSQSEEPVGLADVVAALPPPDAWNALAEAIRKRHGTRAQKRILDHGWLLLAAVLGGDEEAQWSSGTALADMVRKLNPEQKGQFAHLADSIIASLASRRSDPVLTLRALDARIALHQSSYRAGSAMSIPDLVGLVGAARAEQTLRRILLTNPVEISVPSGLATRRLAQRLATELAPKLKAAQWTLSHSIGAVALYEALNRRFPAAKPAAVPARERFGMAGSNGEDSRTVARLYYLMGLVAAGRRPAAEKVALSLRAALSAGSAAYQLTSVVGVLQKAGHGAAAEEFLRGLLARDPSLPLWDAYIPLAAEVGRSDRAIALLRQALAKPGLRPDRLQELRGKLYQALFAADQVDEGITLLRALLKAAGAGPEGSGERASRGIALARVGMALDRRDLIEEGLAAATGSGVNAEASEHVLRQVVLLLELDRGPQAEQLLIAYLARAAGNPEGMGFGQESNQQLVDLAGVYHAAGRHGNVLALLEGSSDWAAADLSEILLLPDGRDIPLGHMAAAALADAGRKSEALRVAEALRRKGSFDPAFQLLVELRGEQAIPFLDSLFARDRFEERPLIWKAYALFRAMKLEEAEKTARQAIAIDPSDGEQHHGRRMRVYAILADILAARGDTAQAGVYRGAVQAIRTAERADRIYEAGLLRRGVTLYRQALTHFADAYCIQSRLAVQLASQGRHEEAEAHYRRAYELMPDSFGRMETHCFGCEGVFEGKQAQNIAEQTFRQLAAKTPEKPQVHYLLGYLRESQERFPEALQHYRTAVKLDPDYLNAWQRILGLGAHMQVPAADQDAATLSLLRLDPSGRHVRRETLDVRDLPALWKTVEEMARTEPAAEAASLFPLKASKEALDAVARTNPEMRAFLSRRHSLSYSFAFGGYDEEGVRKPLTPGAAVARHTIVSAATQVIEADSQRSRTPE